MLSDIVIAQAAKMLPIAKVAEKLGLTDEGPDSLWPLQSQDQPQADPQ